LESHFYQQAQYSNSRVKFGEAGGITLDVLYGSEATEGAIRAYMRQRKLGHGKFDKRIPVDLWVWPGREVSVRQTIEFERGLVNGAEVTVQGVVTLASGEIVGPLVSSPLIELRNQMARGEPGLNQYGILRRFADQTSVCGGKMISRAAAPVGSSKAQTVHAWQGSSLDGEFHVWIEGLDISAESAYTMMTRSRDPVNKLFIWGMIDLAKWRIIRDKLLDRNRALLDEKRSDRFACMPGWFPSNQFARDADEELQRHFYWDPRPWQWRVFFLVAPYYTKQDFDAVHEWIAHGAD
jgi:hypothetical protein